MKTVLIISHSQDLHARLVSEQLQKANHPVFRIDLDRFPAKYIIEMSVDQTAQSSQLFDIDNQLGLKGQDVGAVWIRKSADFSFKSDDLSPQEKCFAVQESEHILYSFIYSLDAYWMSHPTAIRASQWKGEQALRAQRFGFTVPSARMTNSPDCVVKFRESLPHDMITKTMSCPYLAADKVSNEERQHSEMTTTVVTEEHMENIAAVAEIPCYFQERIAKDYELRVTVIGDKVFAAKIDSQSDPRTSIDSRDMTAEIAYHHYQLSPELASQCREFVHSYGLQYGAIDLIITPEGHAVFLENNPAGQFYYVQQLVPELRMIEEVARCLKTHCH